MPSDKDIKLGYYLGQRDMLATVLAETYKKIRLPDQAKFYAKHFEKHFSHDWHTAPQKQMENSPPNQIQRKVNHDQ